MRFAERRAISVTIVMATMTQNALTLHLVARDRATRYAAASIAASPENSGLEPITSACAPTARMAAKAAV